jgi:arylsulfatase A-like enzyme
MNSEIENYTMNLIFITVDGARADRIIHGNNYKKLIKKSAFFPKTITHAPYTIAAMHAIFTGTYGTKTGVNSYWSSSLFKKDQFKTLTSHLQDAGYYTYGDVINKLVLPKIGFDELVIHDELNDDLTERHTKLLDKFAKIKKDQKFFLYLHYSNIHTGIMHEVLKKYDNFSKEYFDNKIQNEFFYDKLFTKADEYLGTIIEHCEKLNLLEDTLLVVISDHGISVGEKLGERAYGVFCYDYTLISTALFHHSSITNKEIQQQVRSIDIFPTILEILSIKQDSSLQPIDGKSLIPILQGISDPRISFSQSGNPLKTGQPPKEPNVWAVRTDKWKFIRNTHNGTEELYNLEDDPQEEENLIQHNSKKASELRNKLQELSQSKLQNKIGT